MIKMVIFDLDDTLVDTSSFIEQRQNKNFNALAAYLPSFTVLNDAISAIQQLKTHGIHIAILTTSPYSYALEILKYFSIPYDELYAFQQLVQNKQEYTKSLKTGTICKLKQTYKLNNFELIFIGDSESDFIACSESNTLFITHKQASAWHIYQTNIMAVDSYLQLLHFLNINNTPAIFTDTHIDFGEHVFFGKYFTDTYKSINSHGHKHSFDAMHKRIVDIKNNRRKPLQNWLAFLINANLESHFQNIDYVTRALGSSELFIDPNIINVNDLIAYTISRKLNTQYRYDLLQKTQINSPLHASGEGYKGRKQLIKDKYIARNVGGKRVLVYDDLFTTGATAVEIKRAISVEHRNNETAFCSLGATSTYTFDDYCQNIANTQYFLCGNELDYDLSSIILLYYFIDVLQKCTFLLIQPNTIYGIIDVRGMTIFGDSNLSFLFFNYTHTPQYMFYKNFNSKAEIISAWFPNHVKQYIDTIIPHIP